MLPNAQVGRRVSLQGGSNSLDGGFPGCPALWRHDQSVRGVGVAGELVLTKEERSKYVATYYYIASSRLLQWNRTLENRPSLGVKLVKRRI